MNVNAISVAFSFFCHFVCLPLNTCTVFGLVAC